MKKETLWTAAAIVIFIVAAVLMWNTKDFISTAIDSVKDDVVFKGTFVLGGMYALKDNIMWGFSFLWTITLGSFLFFTITLANDADNKLIYEQVCFFLRSKYSSRIPNLRVETEHMEYVWLIDGPQTQSGTVNFNPFDGVYWITYKGVWIWVTISTSQLHHGTGFENKPQSVCRIEFFSFGWNSKYLKEFFTEAAQYYNIHKSQDKTSVRMSNPYWPQGKFLCQNNRVKNLDDIILPETIERRILNILDNFKNKPEIWKQHNQIHRESVLLVGPPGNGKTRLISFIAGYLGYDILLINLASGQLDDDSLLENMAKVSPKTLIAIEEIDAAGPQRELKREKQSKGWRQVTMSGLLLALDGPANKDGPIIVATTNCYERLDSALIRPGRFNHHIKLDWANGEQKESIFKKYYPNASEKDVKTLMSNLEGKNISCAALVGFLRGCNANEEKLDSYDAAIRSKMLKSADEVSGTINLDSSIKDLLIDIDASPKLGEYLEKFGITTLRMFKYCDQNNLYEELTEDKCYKLPALDSLALKNLQDQCQKAKDKEGCLVNFSDPVDPYIIDLSERVKNLFSKNNIKILRDLKKLELSDVENMLNPESEKEKSEQSDSAKDDKGDKTNKDKKEKSDQEVNGDTTKENKEEKTNREVNTNKEEKTDVNKELKEEKKEETDKKEKLTLTETLRLRELFEQAGKMEDKTKFVDLNENVLIQLKALNVTEKTQNEILKLGIKTLGKYLETTLDGIKLIWDEPKHKLTLREKTDLQYITNIVSTKVEEKELYA